MRAFLRQYAWLLLADVVALATTWVTMPLLTIEHQRPAGAGTALILVGVVFAVLLVPVAVDMSRRRKR